MIAYKILFIKLFESQLIAFNNNEENFRILNSEKINTFSDLNGLFIQVLNKRIENRGDEYKQYSYIPYLNSSLFELTESEAEPKVDPIIEKLKDINPLEMTPMDALSYLYEINKEAKERK